MPRILAWRDVFNSAKIYPADYTQSRETAKSVGYRYFAFNGAVFHVDQQTINYDESICSIEELI
ncbi:hypothetical protein [Brevibacillus laterosporus]|uniref:Uncharacterized protein n=1 Tax=Brevibacillus laterosporus TaxID=1465 RepID=A0AAP3DMM7_BRELA|nr:hypothetical protein [Brevibacillus laterosporus]MCR8983209.1 hypothetical protein [Brevibacillus laterosporus]MCZ0810365.1 hypothetical protein [Brevibacillus laterosporus]MCZ0828253.1 hypothetical protein [Brevibacillus laterosporus]MCZ0853097.1 hypothetical protein [Brevibacillus laterosporus]